MISLQKGARMKRKRCIYIVLVAVAVCVFAACKNKENIPATPSATPNAVPSLIPSISGEPPLVPRETKEIVIYTINSETIKKEAVTALVYVESELTPELIMEQVIAAMEDDHFYIEIDSITTEGKNIIVSFCAESTPVCNVGASVEGVILDAIGQSLLDNLPDYSGIIYRVEGGAYNSGHLEIGIDEVFISR